MDANAWVSVEGVTWELSGRLYQYVYPVGLMFYASYVSVTGRIPETLLPKRIIHTGIIIHGHLYEYCNEGVKKTKATTSGDPGSVCGVERFIKREVLGKCNKTIGDVDSWAASQKEGRFAKEKYDVAVNQCVHFAIAAADFLEVSHPNEWDRMCAFTEKNSIMSHLANGSTRSSTCIS